MKLQRQIDRLLAQRASEWHQIMEDPSPPQRAEFVAWLKQSPLHVQEYLETVYTDLALGHVERAGLQDLDALLAQVAPSVVALREMPARERPASSRARRWSLGVAAAAVLALCGALLPWASKHFHSMPGYTTAKGEQRTIELADSSVVTLNADSEIRLHMDEVRRDVQLVRGEALFKVAHDAQRPFIVQTRMAMVQAVGTQFNVYELPSRTRISVLEGRVRISALHKRGAAAAGAGSAVDTLGAGEEAQVLEDGTIRRISKADVARTVAWRERRLMFNDAPLEDMVYEFNRYSRTTHLRLDRVPPGSHHYNGSFDAADPESFAELLAKEPDLLIERRGNEIVIRKR